MTVPPHFWLNVTGDAVLLRKAFNGVSMHRWGWASIKVKLAVDYAKINISAKGLHTACNINNNDNI